MRSFCLLFLTLISTGGAFAQCPLTRLSGTWTFNVQAVGPFPSTLAQGGVNHFAVAGQFRASVGTDRAGQPVGVLSINATSLINGSSTRLEGDAGRFQIFDDCSGGTLTMNLSSRPIQYDFWFHNGGQSISLVSTLDSRPAIGNATQGPQGCPVGLGNPLNLLTGAYAFKIQGIPWLSNIGNSYGRAGRFVASLGSNRAGAAVGQLAITVSSNLPTQFSVTRLERDAGAFQINDDCSGGTLTMNLSSGPQQYQFYFRAGFQTLDVIATTGMTGYGVVSQAGAAACPANPLSLVSNAWTFNAQTLPLEAEQSATPTGSAFAAPNVPRPLAAIAGQWKSTGNGTLSLNATSVLFGRDSFSPSVTRLENDFGSYQIFDDCSGGTLTMNLSSFPMQYDFYFFDDNRSVYFVSTINGEGVTGTGYSGAPTACPVGLTNPLNVLSGAYALQFQRAPNFTMDAYSLAGRMVASTGADRAGNPLGLLALTATSSHDAPASITRLENGPGRFQINDDCSGGTLTFNLGSRPVQHQFYFRSGFQAGDAIMTYAAPVSGFTFIASPIIYGTFTR